jgi:DNA-binding transcriptional MerR regulator
LSPRRREAGYRDYGQAEEETVRRIKLLGSVGTTLDTIQSLLPCVKSDHPTFQPCADLTRILTEQVGRLDQQIESLTQSRSMLASFLSSTKKS